MNTPNHFAQCLQKALEIARHAPSSHNCQPWKVEVLDSISDNLNIEVLETSYFIAVSFDPSRLLNALPSLTREMYTSCGVFSAVLTKALTFMGYRCDEHWLDNDELILLIHLLPDKKTDEASLQHLKNTISKRFTNRGAYEKSKMDASQSRTLVNSVESNLINCQLISTPHLINEIAQLIRDYAGLDFSNKKVWKETYGFIRFRDDETVEDGFYMHNLFGSVSWFFTQTFRFIYHPKNHFLSNLFGLPNYMAKGLAQLVRATPQIILLTAKNDSNLSCWQLGQALSSLWLEAQDQGLSLHPLSVLLQNENPRKKLTQILECNEKILFIARLGIAQSPATRTPRRPIQSILN